MSKRKMISGIMPCLKASLAVWNGNACTGGTTRHVTRFNRIFWNIFQWQPSASISGLYES